MAHKMLWKGLFCWKKSEYEDFIMNVTVYTANIEYQMVCIYVW